MIKCGCNRRPCKGECRELHLYRQRKNMLRCPAAYEDKIIRKRNKNEKNENSYKGVSDWAGL